MASTDNPYLPLLEGILGASSQAANTYGANLTAQDAQQATYQGQLIQQALAQLTAQGMSAQQAQTSIKNALQGGLLQGTNDVTVTPPPNIAPYMGTVTGGLRPSAITNGPAIGSSLQQQALLNLMQPDQASTGPMPSLAPASNALNGGPSAGIVQPPKTPGTLDSVLNYALPVGSTILKAYEAYQKAQGAGTAAGTAAGAGSSASSAALAGPPPVGYGYGPGGTLVPTGSSAPASTGSAVPFGGGGGGGDSVGAGLPTGIGTGIYDPQLGGSLTLGVDQPGLWDPSALGKKPGKSV